MPLTDPSPTAGRPTSPYNVSSIMRTTFRRVAIALPMLVVCAMSVHAQGGDNREQVLIAFLDNTLQKRQALIIRYGDGSQPDLIAIGANARPETALAGAVTVLRRVRAETALPAAQSEIIHLTSVRLANDRPATLDAALSRHAARLRQGAVREIGSLGRGRVILLRADDLDDLR